MPGIALTRPVPRSDAALSVTVAFAPFERVLPAVVGLFRAHFGYSLLEDAFENNFATRERLEATETQPNVTHAHVTVISQPKAVPDVTLIEDWPGVISAEAGSMLPDVSFLSLLSHFENARTEQHRMRWQVGPDVIRRVELSRGMEQTGWFWRQEGPVQPFESQERYALRTISTRCDRALLFEYAERLGVDLQATLGDRRFARSFLVRQISKWDATPGLKPTAAGESYRRHAVLAGFGTGEEDRGFEDQAAEAALMQTIEADFQAYRKVAKRARSAKELLSAVKSLGTAPSHPLAEENFVGAWRDAVRRAIREFPGATETTDLADEAVKTTAFSEYGVTSAEVASQKTMARSLKVDHAFVQKFQRPPRKSRK